MAADAQQSASEVEQTTLAPSAFISLICDPIVVETGVCRALPNMLIGGINPFKCGAHLNTPFKCRTGGLKQYVAII